MADGVLAAPSGGSSQVEDLPCVDRATHMFNTSTGIEYSLTTTVSSAASHDIDLRLCDGMHTWTACLPADQLTPPKTVSRDAFHKRLLIGLRGGSSGDDDAGSPLAVDPGRAGAVRLSWRATLADTELGLDMQLLQQVELASELIPGEGLRELLGELVVEVQELQCAAAKRARRATALEDEAKALDVVEARLDEVRRYTESGLARRDVRQLLNTKKRRCAWLHAELEKADADDARSASPGRSDHDGDDDDEMHDEEAQAPGEAGPERSAWTARGPQGAGSGGSSVGGGALAAGDADDEEDCLDLL